MDEQALRRRWIPQGEASLREAFERGMFEERNWCELKREVLDTRSANKELAKDLASLAVDGGTFLIGLDEDVPNGDPLHPVTLKGLPERIEQVARFRIQPSLQLETTPMPSTADPARGYVVVNVPASPLAPHQVEGVYYGRGDKTRIRLSDAEIERLFQRRANWAAAATDDVTNFMKLHNAGSPASLPQLFLTARPAAPWLEMARPLVGEDSWQQRLGELRHAVAAEPGFRAALDRMFPGMGYQSIVPLLRTAVKTPVGARMTMREPQTPVGIKEWDVDLDITEDGLTTLWCALISLPNRNFNGIIYTGVLVDYLAVLVHEFLVTVSVVSSLLRYGSSWDLGLGISELEGSRPIAQVSTVRSGAVGAFAPAYGSRNLIKTARADVLELEQQPGVVAERLLGQFARATSTEKFLAPLLSAPSGSEPPVE